ncbi:MAG: pentapeptide repeat-containing protein [Clostridium sp.]
MEDKDFNGDSKKLYENLRVDCEKCFGICCVALYFSASEGFPINKDAGKPCINLKDDFSCSIHKDLRKKGLKGCTAYDCFGAGQKVAQVTYKGVSWKEQPNKSAEMFDVFLIVRRLHEMLWYLTEAFNSKATISIKDKIGNMISETERLTMLDSDSLKSLDIESHRDKVNALLSKTSDLVRSMASKGQKSNLKNKKTIAGRRDFIGVDFRKKNLKGADLRGAFLIAANFRDVNLDGADFIGADMRDADFRGANLAGAIFITQPQINAAKGDCNTKLPISLIRPSYWEK